MGGIAIDEQKAETEMEAREAALKIDRFQNHGLYTIKSVIECAATSTQTVIRLYLFRRIICLKRKVYIV